MATRGRRKHGDHDHERAERLGRLIRFRRDDRELSQQALASEAGIAISTLRRIERGGTPDPGFFTLADIAVVLHLRLDEVASEVHR